MTSLLPQKFFLLHQQSHLPTTMMVKNLFLFSASKLIIFITILTCFGSAVHGYRPAFFIFGDSTVDPGNNNYIETIPENTANYAPYGQNGFFKNPTGRFSDGRIIVDFLAEFAELPIISAHLDPTGDRTHGVNFASGGAGILSTTNPGQSIDLETQLKYFEKVEKQLTERLGALQAEEVISNAVYFFSMGSNDYLGGYLGSPEMQKLHIPEHFVGMVIGNLTKAIQGLYEKGARKFGFLSLSPLGCLPVMRAMNTRTAEGGCFEQANSLAMAHNNALKSVLTSLEHLLPGFKYSNSDFYSWILDRMNHPSNYGFTEGLSACCGTGPYRGMYTCGGTKKVTTYEVCDDVEGHVWWDSFHPTERIHKQFAGVLWDGPSASVAPCSLQELFSLRVTIADAVDSSYDNPQEEMIAV